MSEPVKFRIEIAEHHSGQQAVIDAARRFNVLCCGRRWGKSNLAQDLLMDQEDKTNGALNGFPVAYFAPTYKMLMDVWRSVNLNFFDIIREKSETEKRVELYTGGIIDFWSLEDPNSIRGRKYRRVVLDESATARNLKEAWLNVIRPTLTDLKGDAWFLSTPKGKNNYFYDLFNNQDIYDDWISWQLPTVANPFISEAEVKEAENQLDPLTFAQEYLASFVTSDLNAYAYSFNAAKHLGATQLNKNSEVYLSFDFNRDPICCGVYQHYNDWIYAVELIKLRNSNVYDLCDYIVANYTGCMFIVTGDASGKASTALVKDNINFYTVIKNKLNLSNTQLRVPSANPRIEENRVLVNSILHNKNVLIDPVRCKGLIFDLEHARVLPDGSLDKTDRNDPTKQLDAIDTFRYYLGAMHKSVLKLS